MKKHLLLLALLAFTQNVKADYAPIEVQLAEGEQYLIDEIIAAQVINQTSWDGQYIFTGGVARVYTDFLPHDGYLDGRTRKYYPLTVEYDTQNQQYWIRWNDQLNSQPVAQFTSPWDAYQWYISSSNTYCNGFLVFHDDEDGNGEYITLSGFDPYIFVGRVDLQTNQPLDYGGQEALLTQATAYNQVRFLQQSDLLEYAQVPINGVSITVTNSSGQVTSQHDYTSYLVSIQSLLRQVNSNLTDLKNALGFSGSASDNLAHFLGQWRTTDGINQGNILNAITNLTDYTDFLKYYIYNGNNITNDEYLNEIKGWYDGLDFFNTVFGFGLSMPEYRNILGSSYANGIDEVIKYIFYEYILNDNSSLSMLSFIENFRNRLVAEGVYNSEFSRGTNIVNAVSLGREWLNLATNDLNSFTYWLNQQTFTQNGTNDISSAEKKWDAITNQYAQISLVGANASNTAQNWDYFKRLEMLLAALVYKPDKMEGDMPQDKTVSQSTEASDKQSEVNQSLDSLASSLSTDSLETSGQSLVSLFTRFQSTLTQSFQPRYIVLFETVGEGQPTRSGSSNDDLDIEIALDFDDERFDGVLDIVRTIFGMVWATIGLFACWAVMKKCYFIGYKIAVFCFAFFRRILGL